MSIQYFAGISKPGKETVAAVSVAAKGFPVYLPVELVWRSHAGKREQISKPLFHRYFFTQFDREIDDYTRIYYCRGVAHTSNRKGIICDAMDRPIPIPTYVIDGIRGRETIAKANAGLITTGYRPGDKFRLKVSDYADLDVVYMGELDGEVTIAYSMFGKEFMKQIPFERVPPPAISFDSRAA